MLAVVWCLCRFVPRIAPGIKVWLWRLAWIKLLLALFWSGSIELPLLPSPPPRVEFSDAVVVESSRLAMPVALPPVLAPAIKPVAILFLLWIAGVVGCLVHLAYQWRHCVGLKRGARPAANDALAELCSRFGIRRVPKLRESGATSAPLLVGILRPVVVVPSAQVPPPELRMMLAHELAHLKRRDLLWGWLPAICQALFFFHPLLWFTRREWLLAQEMACDALALRHSTATPAAYGNMLVDFLTSPIPQPRFGTVGICETTRNLKRRIMAMKMIGPRKNGWLMAALLSTALAGVFPWRIVAQEKPEDAAKRLQQLEQENAALRAEVEKLKQTSEARELSAEGLRTSESARLTGQLAIEIKAAEADLASLRSRYTDQHPRLREAETRLKKLKELQASDKSRHGAANERVARERDLYMEELALAQRHVDSIRKAMDNGRASREELFRAQREMFGIRRELAKFDKNRADIRELVQEEIEIVQRQLKEAQKLVEAGLASSSHDVALRRELLKLKRELLSLE